MRARDGNLQRRSILSVLVARSAAIASLAATAALLALLPAQAADSAPANDGSSGATARTSPSAGASGTVEQDVARLMADIREAEARVASLQRRVETLAIDTRLENAPLHRSRTRLDAVEHGGTGISASGSNHTPAAETAPEPLWPGEDSQPLRWLIGASSVAAVFMLVMARLGVLSPRGTQTGPSRPLNRIRRIFRNWAELRRERKLRARQDKRLNDHLRKIAASSKTPRPATRSTPRLRVVR